MCKRRSAHQLLPQKASSMTEISAPQANPQIRLRLSPTSIAAIDSAVEAGRFPDRVSVVEHALATYFDGTNDRLNHSVLQHSELLAFVLFMNAATLRPQIGEAEISVIRTMAEDLFLNGNTAPVEVLEALGYAVDTGGVSS